MSTPENRTEMKNHSITTSEAQNIDSFIKGKWQYLYFLLAAFDLAAIFLSINQSHQSLSDYKQVIQRNKVIVNALSEVRELLDRAQKANAPGNDIFDSHNLKKETDRYRVASAQFDEQVSKIRTLLSSPKQVGHNNDTLRNQQSALDEIQNSMNAMREVAIEIFNYFKKNQPLQAGKHMAEMDRRYAKLIYKIEHFRTLKITELELILNEHQHKQESLQKLEFVFGLILLLAIVGILIYGTRNNRFVKAVLELSKKTNLLNNELKRVSESLDKTFLSVELDLSGRILNANSNYLSAFGYSREELIGKNHSIICEESYANSRDYKIFWEKLARGHFQTNRSKRITKSGQEIWLNSTYSPVLDESGHVTKVIKLAQNITQIEILERNLKEAQSIAKIGSWKFDLRTNELFWTSEHYRIFEIDEPKVSGELYKLYKDRIHPDDLIALDKYTQRAAQLGEDFTFDHRVYLDGGRRIKYVRGIGRVAKDSAGIPISISGTCQDLSELKAIEEESSSILKTMSEGLIIRNQSGVVEKFNPAALAIFELNEDQLLGRAPKDSRWILTHESGQPLADEEHPANLALRTNKPVHNKVLILTLPSGAERWIRINAIPFQANNERKVAITLSDISEIIKVNRDISHIFNHSIDLICIASTDGIFKRISPSFEKILGWSESELLSKPFVEFVHHDDVDATIQEVKKLASGQPTINFENRYRTRSGVYRLISWVAVPDPKSGLLYATGRDVTEQRRIEIRNKEILNAINRAAIVAYTDKHGAIIDVNDNFCKISGYTREELIGQNHRILNSGAHPKSFFKNLWTTISEGRTWTGDIQNRSKTGATYHVRSVITPLRAIDGSIEQYFAIRFDVTKQKQTEQDLLEAQQTAKIGSWRYDLSAGKTAWSPEHYQIFEIEKSILENDLHEQYLNRVHPDDRSELERYINRARNFGEDFVYNHRINLEGGNQIKHVRCIGRVVKDSHGKPVLISGTSQDITDLVALQEQNQFILEAMGIGIWKFNPVNSELFWDQSMYDLFEVSPKSFSGHYHAWESSLTQEAKATAVQELQLALSGTKDFNTTFEIQTKKGTRKHIGGRGVVIRNTEGQPIMMYGINWDRTPEITYERDLKTALEFNEAIRRSARFSIITTTLDGIITGYNEEAERILGYTADEVIGNQTPIAFHDANELVTVANQLSKELNTEVPVGFETLVFRARSGGFDERDWTFIGKDGRRIPIRLNVTGLHDSTGKLYGFMGIAKDITDQVELQSQLAQEKSKSLHNAKLASLGEMSAGIAHEINNPLAIISGSLMLLNKFKDNPEKFAAKIDAIQRATVRIEKIVKGLKKFSRSSEGVAHKNEALKEILNEVIVLTEAKSKRHSTPITLSIEDDLTIYCDGVEIEQVLINLINNAIDAVKDRSERWVKVIAFESQNHIIIHVIDSGEGLSSTVESKLFQPFFTTKPVGEGTGLGLSITKGILDQHKASIAINHSFKNTCFEIRFPKVESIKKAS